MDADVFVPGGIGGERLRALLDGRKLIRELFHSPLDRTLMGFKPWIIADELGSFCHCALEMADHGVIEKINPRRR